MSFLQSNKAWILLLLVLASIYSFGFYVLNNRLDSDLRLADADADSRASFYAFLLKDRLQAKDFQQARELVKILGENMQDILHIELVTSNGYRLAEYQRSSRSEYAVAKTVQIDYSYLSHAMFTVRISTDHVYQKIYDLKKSFVLGFLMIAVIMIHLVRTNATVISQGKELARENKKRVEAEHELLQHRDHLQEMIHERTVELELARDQALHLTQVKNEFIATMSHELRTPLTSIKGAIELLVAKSDIDLEDRKKLLEIADKNTSRLLHLINELLDVQKIETNFIEFNFTSANLVEIIRQTVDMNRTYAYQRHVTINIDCPNDIPSVWIDTNRLIQVLSNLLSNAVKFSLRESEVTINARKINNHVRIEVNDYGKGVSEEFEPHLFKKFSQHDSSTTRNEAGAGLGLAISKSLIDRMGGVIGYQKNNEGGATFFIELPIAETLQDRTAS